MFNAFLHFQAEAAQAEQALANRQAQCREVAAKKRRARLLRDYKHTLSQRLKQISVQPVVRRSGIVHGLQPVARSFRFTSKDRFERVSEAVTSHAYLDPVPVGRRQSVPRERMKAKEIQPELRFQSTGRRIREVCRHTRGTTAWTVGQPKLLPTNDPRPLFKTIETLVFNAHVPGAFQIQKVASHTNMTEEDQSLFSMAERLSVACGLTAVRGVRCSFLK